MYRIKHSLGSEELAPAATFDTLKEAIDEAKKRMRLPEAAALGAITIDRSEDAQTLRQWVCLHGKWQADPPKGSTAFLR